MSADRDFERTLRDWLAEGPTMISGRALAETLAEIHGARQLRAGRPSWRVVHPGRAVVLWASMAVAVAVVALAIAARTQVDQSMVGQSPVPSPAASVASQSATTPSQPASSPAITASATATPSSPPSALPTTATSAVSPALATPPPALAPLGPLPAGTYTSLVLQPNVTFTTTGDLVLRGERPDDLWLAPNAASETPEFNIIPVIEVGVIDRLAADKRITASQPFDVTVGGHAARAIDVTVDANAYRKTGRNLFVPEAVIVAQTGEWYFYLAAGARGRVFEVVVGSKTILIFYQAQAAAFDAFAGTAEALVNSLRFRE